MAKKSSRFKKFRKIHKITLHSNRWLIWSLVLSAVACVGLVAYIRISNYQTDIEMMEYVPIIRKAITYTDYRLGFSLKHPVAWSAEADADNTISFLDPVNYGEGVSVSVMDLSAEKAYRSTFKVLRETDMTIDSEPGSFITTGIKTAPEKVVIVRHLGRLYVIRGTGLMYDRILPTFKFTGFKMGSLPGAKLNIQPAKSAKSTNTK